MVKRWINRFLWLHAKTGEEVYLWVHDEWDYHGFVISRGFFRIHIRDFYDPTIKYKIFYPKIKRWAIV